MSQIIETPPLLTGSTPDQLQSLYAYLFRLSQSLNIALEAAPQPVTGRALPGSVPGTPGSGDYSGLHSLILTTAQTVRREMDRLETVLRGQTEAVSDQFGSFKETLTSTITATAREVVQSYGYDAAIQALDRENNRLDVQQRKTEGFIRSGFIDYAPDGTPLVGIAIGQNLSSQTVETQGQTLEQFDPAQSCTFYTAEKVSFRMQGREIAYVSNRKLYIGDVQITGSAQLGPWRMGAEKGLTVQWIGGM